ncbi:hypothetical protein [Aeromicrobium sp.]|uniref:hypothetical protein n=1 Tax=Aeromicrobium sp. TaxID=1871063 RepID=UPI0025C4F4AB|nr:hypothetical protein [Aeromicrobium sp.]MCK5891068.1 hypothetical protein [Aeromicrobium sp.]
MSTLRRIATWVRRATWAVTAAAVVIAVAVAMFDAGRHSAGDRELTVSPAGDRDLVAAAVADVEAQGLRCTRAPSLADGIVFERLDGTVALISFDEALVQARSGAGWVRWYCSWAGQAPVGPQGAA